MQAWTRKLILFGLDLMLINLAYYLAIQLRFDGRAAPQYIEAFILSMPLFSIVTIALYWVFGLYNSLWRYASINEFVTLVIASSIASIGHFILLDINRWTIPKSVFIIAWMITILFVTGSRFAYRILRRLVRRKATQLIKKRVMIVGAGDAGANLIKEMIHNPHSIYQPMLIVDDAPGKRNNRLNNVPVKGAIEDIPKLVSEEDIDEIIVAIPSAPASRIKEILDLCAQTPCKLRILPSLDELFDQKAELKAVRDVEITDLLGRPEVQLDISGIEAYIKDQVVLITGGGGSIGSELARQIVPFKPSQLLLLDIYENNVYDLQLDLLRKYPNLNLKVLIASVRDKEKIHEIFAQYKPNIVFHAAAHKHVPLMEDNPSAAVKNNIFGTLNVAQSAHEHGTKRFIMISTDKAVNPTNIMGATKRVCELIIQSLNKESETEFVAVRFGNVLGSNGSVIPLFKKQIAQGGPVTLTHPDITRYFMTIPEAARLVIQAGAIAQGGEIFVLDMGKPVRIMDLAIQLIKLSGFIPNEDIKIEITGLRPGEKLYEELLLEEEGLLSTKQQGILIAKPSDVQFNEVVDIINEMKKSLISKKIIKQNLGKLVPSLNDVQFDLLSD